MQKESAAATRGCIPGQSGTGFCSSRSVTSSPPDPSSALDSAIMANEVHASAIMDTIFGEVAGTSVLLAGLGEDTVRCWACSK